MHRWPIRSWTPYPRCRRDPARKEGGDGARPGDRPDLAWGSTYYLPAILADSMADDLGLSRGFIYAAFSAALVVSAFAGPLAGRAIDRVGGRPVLLASNVVLATGLALLATATGPALLFVAWLVIGVGMAMGLYEAAFSTLAGIWGREARGAITGITLIAGFASTVGWPLSAALEVEFGWRGACLAWAAGHLLVGLPLNALFVPAARFLRVEGDMAAAPAGRGRTMALLALVFAVAWFTSTAMAAHLPQLLQQTGATPTAAVAAAALVGPAQVAGRLLEFGLARRMHPLLSARLAALAHPSGAALLLVFGAPAAMLFTLAHGAGNGILTIAKGTLPLALFGPAGYGFRQGMLMAPARFAQAGAPFAFALLMESHGPDALLLSITLGLTGFAALLALAPVAATDLPESGKTHAEDRPAEGSPSRRTG